MMGSERIKSFRRFLGILDREGFIERKIQESDGDNSGFSFYTSIINRELEGLDLTTYLSINVDYISLNTNAQIDKFIGISKKHPAHIPFKVIPRVIFRSMYSDDFDEINPEEWNEDLIRRVKKEVNIIESLEAHLLDYDRLLVSKGGIKGLGRLNGSLYVNSVKEGKLRWFDFLGDRFPYVVTDSIVIEGVGSSASGLYFVATDIANEPWKELVVAYHERFCDPIGHRYAKEKESELAKHLGKEQEWENWRASIDNGF